MGVDRLYSAVRGYRQAVRSCQWVRTGCTVQSGGADGLCRAVRGCGRGVQCSRGADGLCGAVGVRTRCAEPSVGADGQYRAVSCIGPRV